MNKISAAAALLGFLISAAREIRDFPSSLELVAHSWIKQHWKAGTKAQRSRRELCWESMTCQIDTDGGGAVENVDQRASTFRRLR